VKIAIEQAIDVPPAQAMAAYGSPAFYEGRPVRDDIAVLEVVRHEELGGGRTLLEVHFAFQGSVSAAVRRVIDQRKMSWVTRTEVFPDERRASWVVLPDHYPDRLTASGAYGFVPAPAGTLVTCAGELRVHMPIVGGTVERAIFSGLRKYIEAEVRDIPDLATG
jgi:hypothetical protein